MAMLSQQHNLLTEGARLPDWPFVPPNVHPPRRFEPGAYQFLMVDPPWRFLTRSPLGVTRKAPEHHYKTMSLAEIQAMPVGDLAADDCLLWLWATAPMLLQGLETMDKWGFKFTTMGGWVKTTVNGKLCFGTGYVMRSTMEPVLIGKRGNPKTTNSTRNVIMGLRREHSEKPEEAYPIAEKMMPGAKRAEIFARRIRPGWDAFGDEISKFEAVAS